MQSDRAAELEAIVRHAFARWNAGERDPDGLGDVREDLVIHSRMAGREFHGRQGLIDWMAEIDQSFGAWRLSIDEIRPAAEERLLVLGAVHLKGRGSGVEFDQPMGWVIEFEDNQVRRIRIFGSHQETIAAAARA